MYINKPFTIYSDCENEYIIIIMVIANKIRSFLGPIFVVHYRNALIV